MKKRYRLENGLDFEQVHKAHMKHMTGVDYVKGSNADKVFRYLDKGYFKVLKELEECGRALSIDEARGNELDDLYGDKLGIPRNGRSDDVYRFILKAHSMVNNSDGTLPKLIHIASSLLGCKPTDIHFANSRHRLPNGRWVGKPDMIILKDINMQAINNPAMIPYLEDALQKSIGAGKQLHSIQLNEYSPQNIYVGFTTAVCERIQLNFPKDIETKFNTHTNIKNGVSINASAKYKV